MSYEVVDGVRNGARRAWDVTESAATSAKSTVESAAQTAAQAAAGGARTAASGARSGFFDGVEKLTKIAGVVRAFGIDDALLRMGLQRRRSFLADLGVFGAGFAAGAAVTALSTPLSGRALRRQLGAFFGELATKGEDLAGDTIKNAGAQVSSAAHDVRDVAAHNVDAVKQTAAHAKDSVVHAKDAVVSKIHDITDASAKPDDGPRQPGRGN